MCPYLYVYYSAIQPQVGGGDIRYSSKKKLVHKFSILDVLYRMYILPQNPTMSIRVRNPPPHDWM